MRKSLPPGRARGLLGRLACGPDPASDRRRFHEFGRPSRRSRSSHNPLTLSQWDSKRDESEI